MATAVQLRRGTTTQNNAFTGALGEVSVDTTLDTIRVHDASTQGGFEITSNAAAQTLTNKTLTAPTITGTAVMATLDISGNVDVDGTLETDALTIAGVTIAETISDTVGAMVSSNTETGITVAYQDADNTLDFALGAAQTTVNSILATDLILGEDAQTAIDFGTADEIDFLAANAVRLTLAAGALRPQTNNQIDLGTSSLEFKDAFFDGTVTSDAFAGPLTGNVTGNASGTALTVTQAAQSAITSLGTLTALTVDDVVVDGKVITMTGSSGDTFVTTVAANGATSLVTVDAAAAAAHLTITADGTVDINSAGVLTLDSGAAINIEPAAGSAILLDGTISIDAGVVTGATSITSTAFVGGLTGNVTGNASGTALTVTQAAQSAITSLGTLTALAVDDVAVDGKVITMTGSASDTAVFTAGANGTLSIVTTDAAAAAANITITADGTAELAGTTVTLNSSTDIVLDADGADIVFKDGGTSILTMTNSSTDFVMTVATQDKDFKIVGDDGGSAITPFVLDMSAGGDMFLTGGLIDLKNDGSAVSQIKFYCESSNAHAQTLIGAPHAQAADNVLTLPDGSNGVLLSTVSTATVTNKTFTSPKINENVALTSTATELNLLDGVSGLVQADFTKLAAVDATAAELNILDDATLTVAELNILDASAGNTALATDAASSAGDGTTNTAKISHTLTLAAELADDGEQANITITNNKVLATSVVLASASIAADVDVHTVVAGSFDVRITNKSGGALANDSTMILNYRVL